MAIDPTRTRQIVSWDTFMLPRAYTWRSKLFQLPKPISFNCCQIKALDFGDVTIKFYANKTLFFTKRVTSEQEFVIPSQDPPALNFEFEVSGTSPVTQVEIAEEMSELA